MARHPSGDKAPRKKSFPPIPPDSPLRSLFPNEPLSPVLTGGAGMALMVTGRLFGSLALSLPLLGTLLVGIVLAPDPIQPLPSPYGAHPAWMIVLCGVLFLLHAITFLRATRRVRLKPADPRPLVRALHRGPWLLWLFALILLVPDLYQRGRGSFAGAVIAATLALLTHLAVWASLRKRGSPQG